MLGPCCMWRSCIISREFQDSQNDSNLCMWHTSVQRYLEADEWRQYTPNECRVKEERFIVETEALVERTKRVILVSSSLLEELSTRHLPQSIEAFYEHVINTSSNHVYQTEESHRELRRLVHVSEEILDTENCATRELKQLLQLTVYPGVADSYIQHDFFDVGELQSDIRTRDLELRLRLGRQKLQILMRRRKDEEIQVVSSTPLPGMNFHAAPRQAGLNNPEIGPSVYDVIHVMRKGRQSLLRQQRRHGHESSHESKRYAQLTR
ncbi:uncharacterized protein PITG_01488 [Phytophthora infestans T30-4]|uniref:Uncharacterized protein n=1 Tax=Phytophthora infestans (strain T30-4) TaxID=403677 RepID=D0MTD5_PHYIT|nr:uncharacterized protein PITG_01488 [Phytophthora infestans T30-4]EEY61232.1 conserved hypothetical protein [Phytophthora infestans T30-4]|eukprot:XP_002908149.1 conserved hypothetical protein [Phytophthora infestans T30-4]